MAIAAAALVGAIPATAQAAVPQSANVALVPNAQGRSNFGGTLPTTGFPGGYAPTFTNVTVESIRDAAANPLTGFDTVVLNGICDISTFLANAQFKSRIEGFAASGGKLIIYDSECAPTSYNSFVYPFTTSNPGPLGATGTLTIAENNTLGNGTPADPSFLDVSLIGAGTDAVGDANVFTSFDANWCVHMRATNVLSANGPTTAYAHLGSGLIIYSGLDKDEMNAANGYGTGSGASNLNRVFLLQLQQSFNPDNLPCGVKVFGLSLTPKTDVNEVGTSHTVTARLTSNGLPVANTTVSFSVSSGPNAGRTGTGTTNASGDATFAYVGSGGVGTDTIQASATLPGTGGALTAVTGTAAKEWVGDANIQIAPAAATSTVGTNHTLTVTVSAVGGTLAAGTATASVVGGPGGFVGSPTCAYAGGGATASCTVVITSSAAGTTVVQATSVISVGGQSIPRTTGTAANTAAGGSGNAQKTWTVPTVDATIQLTPTAATSPAGTNHTLTVTVNAFGGTLAAGTATVSILGGPGDFVGSPTCAYAGGGDTASCTVVITSTAAGTTVLQATSVISVSGQSIPRTTGTAGNFAAGGGGIAVKTWTVPAVDDRDCGKGHDRDCGKGHERHGGKGHERHGGKGHERDGGKGHKQEAGKGHKQDRGKGHR